VDSVSRQEISDILLTNGITSPITKIRESSGGSGSSSFVITTSVTTLFLKINSAEFAQNFESEIVGLSKIAETETFFVPTPLFSGVLNGRSYLGLSYIPRLRRPTLSLSSSCTDA
jgi:fructosamine-3-kinase